MARCEKANTSPHSDEISGSSHASRAGGELSGLDGMWIDAPPPTYLEHSEAKQLNEQILHELIDIGEVDCDRVVLIVQLMAYREFEAFFQALCHVSMENPARSADRLTRCANRLIPRQVWHGHGPRTSRDAA